jgi:hypothetical protein
MKTFKRVAGLLLILLSFWGGAYLQELTGGIAPYPHPAGPYAWPAFITAVIAFMIGAALVAGTID